ncbi:MAG: MATE family efflux transporter [Ruminiclostridium sp.]
MSTFIHYVSRNVLGMLGFSFYILADTFFIARGVGENGLAALNIAIPVYSFSYAVGLMLGMGGGTRFAILKASGEKERCSKVFTEDIITGLAIGVFVMLMGIFFSEPISRIAGADSAILETTNIYVKTVMCFAPAFIINNIITPFVRNDGAPGLAMAAMLSGSVSNVIFDYIFIFPCKMGMFGAALATGFAPAVGILVCSVHFLRKRSSFKLIAARPHFGTIKDICALGNASFIGELSNGIVIFVLNLIILGIAGNTGVAAYGVVANAALVVMSVFTGISQGIQPIVSKAYGQGNKPWVKKTYAAAIATSLIFSVLVYAAGFIFAEPVSMIFNPENNPLLTEIASEGIRIYFIGFVFAGINVITAVFFGSIEKTASSFVISILRGIGVVIPTAFILSSLLGMTGVWLTFPVTELIVFLAAVIMKKITDK